MAIEITVPRLGWSAEEATFASWLKKDGETVSAGDELFVLEGDKSLQEIESMDAGVLRLSATGPKPGEIVKVGQLIGYLTAPGETLPNGSADAAPAMAVASPQTAAAKPAPPEPATIAPATSRETASTPRARRVAGELGVDLTTVDGTGRDGRIRERDIRTSAAAIPRAPEAAALVSATEIAVTPMRRTIADRMMQSLSGTAPVTLTSRVDATNLVALRNQFKSAKGDTVVPAYTDIIAKLAAVAMAGFPQIMGQWKGDRIVVPDRINIGIAVDTEYGLMVPVIQDVPSLSLTQLAQTSRKLIDQALARKLNPENMTGGIFTVTNLGAFDIDAFTPIINTPETAILGLGAIRSEPMVLNGRDIVVRERMVLSLTFDHRVLDGAPAARFLQALGRAIENPMVWLLSAEACRT